MFLRDSYISVVTDFRFTILPNPHKYMVMESHGKQVESSVLSLMKNAFITLLQVMMYLNITLIYFCAIKFDI